MFSLSVGLTGLLACINSAYVHPNACMYVGPDRFRRAMHASHLSSTVQLSDSAVQLRVVKVEKSILVHAQRCLRCKAVFWVLAVTRLYLQEAETCVDCGYLTQKSHQRFGINQTNTISYCN